MLIQKIVIITIEITIRSILERSSLICSNIDIPEDDMASFNKQTICLGNIIVCRLISH
jgi:hypothetical protein